MGPDDLISFSDAAREIGCSRSTLSRAADDGRLNDVEVRVPDARRRCTEDFELILTGARVRKLSDEDMSE